MKLILRVAQNTSGRRSATLEAMASSVDYAILQPKHKLNEPCPRNMDSMYMCVTSILGQNESQVHLKKDKAPLSGCLLAHPSAG